MKKYLYLAIFCLLISFNTHFWASATTTSDSDVTVAIIPGTFYLSIVGDMVDGIVLSGVGEASPDPKTGHWNGTKGSDYILFYDSSVNPGFRIRTSIGGDFVYTGDDAGQLDIPASNFKVFAENNGSNGVIPTKDFDDDSKTLSINSAASCGSVDLNDYTFNVDFIVDDYAREYSVEPFDYLTSQITCVNTGSLNFGRFELDMGIPSAGKYSSSLYIIMLDGF